MSNIYRNSRYLTSAYKLSQLPDECQREVAFVGRSNAGKSSAINAITQQKQLARVSRTPGRTQMIHYFEFAPGSCLVDLPGYGYAKVPQKLQQHWQLVLPDYFAKRQSLLGLIIIMDSRHPLQPGDWQIIRWAAASGTDLHILLTKADKLSRNQMQQQLRQVCKALEAENIAASLQSFSALNKHGIDDIYSVLDQWFGMVNV